MMFKKSKHIYFLILTFQVYFVLGQTSLPQWKCGMMDIHHIQTGRGNATYFIFPDGTTMLFDAGEISETHPRTNSNRNSKITPNVRKKANQWVVDYIQQFAPAQNQNIVNYAVISHFHDDHFGEWDSTLAYSKKGNYRLTGITGVGELLKIESLIDRGHIFPINLKSNYFRERFKNDEYHIVQTLDNYLAFIATQQKSGLSYDTLKVGSSSQFQLRYSSSAFPDWSIMNISAGGKVATGYEANDFTSLYPAGTYPGENPLSISLKINFGKFNYYTGGDLSGMDEFGEGDNRSMEANIAPVVGPVDVAVMNHHGNRDSQSPYFVRTLRPRVWIQQTWSSDHPGQEVLRRVKSTSLYPGPRDIFATDFLSSNIDVIGSSSVLQSYKSTKGHIVIRVYNNGDSYKIFILDEKTESRNIKSIFGPYSSR